VETTPPGDRTVAADLALLFVLATLWGASCSFIKSEVESIPPMTLIALRASVAAMSVPAGSPKSAIPANSRD
jgi:drug/metabolite transporter (DMT)-like permease